MTKKRGALKATKILREQKKLLTDKDEIRQVQDVITILGRLNTGRYIIVDQVVGGVLV